MKRLKLLLVLISTLLLTGCIKDYNVSEEESNAVTEYMAGMILKYDRGYEEDLIPLETTEDNTSEDVSFEGNSEEDYSNSSDTAENMEPGLEDAFDDYTLTQIIDKSGFTVKYKDFKLVDTYPEDPVTEGFYLEYNEGFQYLVASFVVKNATDEKNSINLIKSGIRYELIVNGNKEYEPSLTLLENDLRYLDLSIEAGKSKKVLLIFKVSKETDTENIKLKATNDKKSVTIILR